MLKYIANHPAYFSSTLAPFFISQMQLSGALFTEIINICLICGQPTIMDCIMNLIALGAISQIDDFYAKTLTYCPLREAVQNPPRVDIRSRDQKFRERTLKGKALRLIYRFYRILFVSFYFYFTPFLTLIFTYLIGGNIN
jgi:hypothetical protein